MQPSRFFHLGAEAIQYTAAAERNGLQMPTLLFHAATHVLQMKKAGPPHASKRPSRRHRRRPSNLLQDYARRRRTHVWLETHIWHAKRFHMVRRWGYALALRSNERGVRAAYRSTVQRCLMLVCCSQFL